MPLPIIIHGALGKMGVEIGAIALSDDSLSLAAAVERPGHPQRGEDYGMCIGKGRCGTNVTDAVPQTGLENAVVIDFSSPQSTAGLLTQARRAKTSLVIGTTGLTEETFADVKKAAERVPVLYSPNMSRGVNLLFSLTERACTALKHEFDIEIVEAHHRFKKDAPSGTAKRLGEIVAKAYGLPYDTMVRNERSGDVPDGRPQNEVGIHALRAGDIVGDHTVLFAGIGERIELRHMAHSRTTLARGAVAAAKWISTREPGYYSMRDVLGI